MRVVIDDKHDDFVGESVAASPPENGNISSEQSVG